MLTEGGYLRIEREVDRIWDFEIIGTEQIIATSNESAPFGGGYQVIYDLLQGRFSFVTPSGKSCSPDQRFWSKRRFRKLRLFLALYI